MTEDKMKQALLLAADILIEHGLQWWQIKVVNRRTSLAVTDHSKKTIELSKRFLLVATKEQVRGVILHEVAHALLGPGYGHGEEFVKKCKEISGTTDYATVSADIAIRTYLYSCPKCGNNGGNNRLAKAYCAVCFKQGDVVELDVTKNKIEVRSW